MDEDLPSNLYVGAGEDSARISSEDDASYVD
jgi:hypothetical protein